MRAPDGASPFAIRLVAQAASGVIDVLTKVRRAARGYATVELFGSHGVGFEFDPDGTYSYETIHVGDNVSLGVRPTLLATRSTIRIGNDVMFGPEVTVRGGNHRFDLVGVPTRQVTDAMKRPEDDQGVVIEDDVWIGARAIILQGVTIGRGSVIGAGSVVTRSIPPYSVAAGNPARVIRQRFDAGTALCHEAILKDAPARKRGPETPN